MALRYFTFMESWLDDMKDWTLEEKQEAVWNIVNYGIYQDKEFLTDLPGKEKAWYNNAFRVIDSGKNISQESSERGARGGRKNKKHFDDTDVERAILAGCKKAKDVAEFLEGEGADAGWVFKKKAWKDRDKILESVRKLNNSNGKIDNEEIGKSLESTQIPMESNGKKWEYDF